MHDFEVIREDTPVLIAKKRNEGFADLAGMPVIYHKDFDLNEFIGEEAKISVKDGMLNIFFDGDLDDVITERWKNVF